MHAPHIAPALACSYPRRGGNLVRPLIDGIPAFRAISDAVAAARHSVWVTVAFLDELKDRIYHVHAKDGEVVEHNVKRSGRIPQGDWRRLGRGFRFRTPGWGSVPWKKVITELSLIGYDYVMSYEHEDVTMSRRDGITKTIAFLQPLLIDKPYEGRHDVLFQ